MLWGKLLPVFDIFSHGLLYMVACVGGILGSEEMAAGGGVGVGVLPRRTNSDSVLELFL